MNSYCLSAAYIAELRKWAGRMNLLSKGDIEKIVSRHFLDSMIVESMIPAGSRVLDVGGGNGFPAIPLAVFRKDLQIVSFEAKAKKAIFLNNIKNKLNLINYKVINERIEENKEGMKKYFTTIISRAYKDAASIIKETKFYCKDNTIYLIYNKIKDNDNDGINKCQQDINTVDKFVYYLPDAIERHLQKIRI